MVDAEHDEEDDEDGNDRRYDERCNACLARRQ